MAQLHLYSSLTPKFTCVHRQEPGELFIIFLFENTAQVQGFLTRRKARVPKSASGHCVPSAGVKRRPWRPQGPSRTLLLKQ